jgi:hypothetical protein
MHPIFERFMNPATMIDAEQELLDQGAGAVAALADFFSGEARNEWDVPYRQFGLPMRCALEVARRMGPAAKPLEAQLRAELDDGHFAAATALGALGVLDETSIRSLARRLRDGSDMASESALALIRCGVETHPLVTNVLANSYQATREFRLTEAYAKRSGGEQQA